MTDLATPRPTFAAKYGPLIAACVGMLLLVALLAAVTGAAWGLAVFSILGTVSSVVLLASLGVRAWRVLGKIEARLDKDR